MKIMIKGIGVALLVVGIALIIYGFNTLDLANSDMSHVFTGVPITGTMWLLLGGSVAVIVGAEIIFRRSKKT
jgi:hypothetical protein